jgi:hypothetical protein
MPHPHNFALAPPLCGTGLVRPSTNKYLHWSAGKASVLPHPPLAFSVPVHPQAFSVPVYPRGRFFRLSTRGVIRDILHGTIVATLFFSQHL